MATNQNGTKNWKADLIGTVRPTQQSLVHSKMEDSVPTASVAPSLYHHLPVIKSEVLLLWFFSLQQTKHLLCRNIQREVCDYLHHWEPLFLHIKSQGVQIFHFCKGWGEEVRLERSIQWGNYGVYVRVGDMDVICCGGVVDVKSVYLLHISASLIRVESWPDTKEPRAAPGAFYYKGSLLLFGGVSSRGGALTSSEQLPYRSAAAWKYMQTDMTCKRWGFTPCQWKQQLFLCGGMNCRKVDIFDLEEQRIVRSHAGILKSIGSNVVWARYGKIVIITEENEEVLDLSTNVFCTSYEAHTYMEIFTNCIPVYMREWAAWVSGHRCVLAHFHAGRIFLYEA